MWFKLIFHSFRRDRRKKATAIAAVMLATCLATFLLNWSFNLGDKLQHDLRAYGANILITPRGESLAPEIPGVDPDLFATSEFLNVSEIDRINERFWKNQIVGMAPLLPVSARYRGENIPLIGTSFGRENRTQDFRKAAPYLQMTGSWPQGSSEAAAGELLSRRFGWKIGDLIPLELGGNRETFRLAGIIRSGGSEEHQLIANLDDVQRLSGKSGKFKRLMVSAMVSPQNELSAKYQRNPESLTPQEFERYSCTPYINAVASDIAEAFSNAESRVVLQISRTEEKFSQKVNWLMILVTFAALVASSLTMTSTTTAMILERRKELALMKAIGSHNAFIISYLFTEVLILGIIGSVAGYALGSVLSVGLSRTIFDTPLELKWIVLPLAATAGIVIILIGSLWPLRQATALEPSQALRDL
jgi:putative ABC transport system permease protein